MEIIDVTIREGALRRIPLSKDFAIAILKKLSNCGLEYIEIGYINSSQSGNPTTGYNKNYICKAADVVGKSSKLAVMLHPKGFLPHKYDKDVLARLGLVRIVIRPNEIDAISEIIPYFKSMGVLTSVNIVRASECDSQKFPDLLKEAVKYGANYFYIADSNGNLTPSNVEEIFTQLRETSPIKLGFHAHNNLGLASANAIAAMKSGVGIIDGTLCGYGKGAGNLRLELIPLLLARMGYALDAKRLNKIFGTAKFFKEQKMVSPDLIEEFKFMVYGAFNMNLDIGKKLDEEAQVTGKEEIWTILDYVGQILKNDSTGVI